MKILYHLLAPLDGFHGASKHVLGLTEGIVNSGTAVRILCADDRLHLDLPGREILALAPGSQRGISMVTKMLGTMDEPWLEDDDTVIYTRASHFGFTSALIARRARRPFVVELNGMPEFAWIENEKVLKNASLWQRARLGAANLALRESYWMFLSSAHALFVNNPEAREHLVLRRNIEPERVHIVPLGYDPRHARPRAVEACRRALGLPEEDRYVIHVGSLLPYKGVECLLNAFARVRPDGWKLLFVGDGPCRGELEAIARERGIENHVRFVGEKPFHETPLWVGASSLAVGLSNITPLWGCCPTKVVEYVACGVPVLTNRMAITEDLARHMPVTLIDEATDEIALTDALRDLLASDIENERVTTVPPAVEAYSWDAIGRRAAEILTTLTVPHRRGEAATDGSLG